MPVKKGIAADRVARTEEQKENPVVDLNGRLRLPENNIAIIRLSAVPNLNDNRYAFISRLYFLLGYRTEIKHNLTNLTIIF